MEGEALGATALLSTITYARVALVPMVMGLILLDERVAHARAAGALLFAFAAFTDFLDGYLARRWSHTSTLGSFLDTTADKLLVSGALFALVAVNRASPWIAALIVGRELAILGLRGVVAAEGTLISPSIWGKIKANVQFAAILLAIVRMEDRLGPLFLDEWVMILAAIVTLLSGLEYLSRFSSRLSRRRGS